MAYPILRHLALSFGVLLAACAAPSRDSKAEQRFEPAPSAAWASRSTESAPSSFAMASEAPPPSRPAPAARLLVMTSSIRLATTEIDSVLDAAELLAARLGGLTDRRNLESVVVRVPVARFDEAFQALLLLGRVLDHRRTAQDVTDQFTDIGLQVRIQSQLLHKLQEILGLETDLGRRKMLLQEIQTTSETLERLQRSQALLKRQADFSTITLSCEAPRQRSLAGLPTDLRIFAWIHTLQARSAEDHSTKGKRLELVVPAGMVELPKRDARQEWMAAAPEGSELRGRILPNEPVGDGRFWREALRLRLAGGFESHDTLAIGRYQVLRLVSAEPRHWVWWLAVATDDRKLHLVQAFYPDSSLERRERPALEQALRAEVP